MKLKQDFEIWNQNKILRYEIKMRFEDVKSKRDFKTWN